MPKTSGFADGGPSSDLVSFNHGHATSGRGQWSALRRTAFAAAGFRVRVAIIGSRGFPYVYSGYETFVSEVAPRLAARGHEVTVHCHRELFATQPTEVRGVKLLYVGGASGKSLTQLSHSLSSVVVMLRNPLSRPDVALFVNAANGLLGPLLRAGGIRTAINVDGLEWERPKWKGLGARVYRLAARMATQWFDLVITDAKAMADVYTREFGAPSTVIEYGAHIWDSTDATALGQLGLVSGEYYLIVGRMIPDNNVLLLVEGFVKSASRRKLVVVGDVPYRDTYADAVKATRDERVVFTGYVRDQALLRELYCGAYAYMHGHEHGGTNPALLKALGAGCAVAALDTPFAREVLRGERHGRYFAKSAADVARCVDALDQAPGEVRALREIAREPIVMHYNWERITDLYESALTALRP